MNDTKEALELIKKQLDEWEEEGILEEKLIEHGFIVLNKTPNVNSESSEDNDS